jgi:NADPH:quinone reductase-like Zn-dependent oxidoreductase
VGAAADRAGRVAGEEARCDIGRGRAAVPALTAEQTLSEAVEIKAGETLLIHGGGGVTGGLLVALAAARGGFRRALSNDRH